MNPILSSLVNRLRKNAAGVVVVLASCCGWGAIGLAQSTLVPSDIVPATRETQEERQALKAYLKTHQLYQLYAELLEEDLATSTDPLTRAATAAELSGLYAWELNTRPARFEQLGTRLDELARDFPDAIPLATQINIASGRYRRAKDVFETWIWDRENIPLRRQVDSRFVNVIQRASDSLEQLERRLSELPQEPESRRELESAASRFRYLAAWARYYRAIATDEGESRIALLQAAERDFLFLLEIADSTVLTSMSPQWWPLNSEWTCRLLLGLGMTNQALGQIEPATFCFNLLTESRVPLSIREHQRVWRFHSYVFPGQLQPANRMVVTWESSRQAEDDVAFWSAVTIAGINARHSGPSSNLIRAGFTGLARGNEFQLIDEIHLEYANVTVSGDSFFARWMNGYAILKNSVEEKNESSNSPQLADLAQAISELKAALATASMVDPVYRARCRYHFGFAHYSARQFVQAAEQFRRSSTVLRSLDPVLAEHAAWMQCQSLHRVASLDTGARQSLVFALTEFLRQYPESPNASQAAFMQVMNQLDQQSGEQAINTLMAIEPGDANYPKALFEICRLRHQIWSSTTEATTRDDMAIQTVDSAQRFIDEIGRDPADPGSSARFMRICLLAADVLVQQANLDQAGQWLDKCEPLPTEIRNDREVGPDYHFLLMKVASLQGHRDSERQASDWLLLNTTEKLHLRAALISRARILDQELAETAQSEHPDSRQYEQVIDAYQRLIEEYTSEDDYWADAPVVRSALLRLAELQTTAGDPAEARKCYLALYQVAPTELVYLLGLARVEMQLARYTDAADRWRRIAAGLSAGHESWMEARYNLAVCLKDSQPENAKSVLEQARLLVPEMPTFWATRFDELETRLAGQN